MGGTHALFLAFQALLGDGDEKTRGHAAETLGKVARVDDPAAVRGLLAATKDAAPAVRGNVATALGRVSPASPAVRTILEAQAARDAEPLARAGALTGLGFVGAEARPVLIQAMTDADLVVRFAAAESLVAIDPSARDPVPILIEAVVADKSEVTGRAVDALGRMGPAANEAAPALRALARGSPFYVEAVRETLARIEGRMTPTPR